MYTITMDRRRQSQYDGLTAGRFGFSDHAYTRPWEDRKDQGIAVAYVDHPRRWAKRFRHLHTMTVTLLRGDR